MFSPRYLLLTADQKKEENPQLFKLHDSPTEFLAYPRVFTSFLALSCNTPPLAYAPLKLHLNRLIANATSLELSPFDSPYEELEHFLLEQFRTPDLIGKTMHVRLVLSIKGAELYLESADANKLSNSAISLITICGEREKPEIKSTNTELCRTSKQTAVEQGADEALLVDHNGKISECSWSNFFWVNANNQICTRNDSVLPGVLKELICKEREVIFRSCTTSELFLEAREAFVSSSLRGIVPVNRIDYWAPPCAAPGPITKQLINDLKNAWQVYYAV